MAKGRMAPGGREACAEDWSYTHRPTLSGNNLLKITMESIVWKIARQFSTYPRKHVCKLTCLTTSSAVHQLSPLDPGQIIFLALWMTLLSLSLRTRVPVDSRIKSDTMMTRPRLFFRMGMLPSLVLRCTNIKTLTLKGHTRRTSHN